MENDAQKAYRIVGKKHYIDPGMLSFYANEIEFIIDQYVNNFADDMDRTIEE